MNHIEAKTVLLLYRPGSTDAEDPEVAAALLLVKQDAELAHWFAAHCAAQEALRGKFRNITAPAGLKEQIISEQAALRRASYWRPRVVLVGLAVVLAILLAPHWWPAPGPVNYATLENYENDMAANALSGYGMELTTNADQVHAILAKRQAPSGFALPASLGKVAIAGCAVEGWQGANVAMVCFQTGRSVPQGQASDLWLFVSDRAAITDAPEPGTPRIVTVGQLTAAVWAQDDKVYMLGLQGDEALLRKFL